jgi:hypothetical protein
LAFQFHDGNGASSFRLVRPETTRSSTSVGPASDIVQFRGLDQNVAMVAR